MNRRHIARLQRWVSALLIVAAGLLGNACQSLPATTAAQATGPNADLLQTCLELDVQLPTLRGARPALDRTALGAVIVLTRDGQVVVGHEQPARPAASPRSVRATRRTARHVLSVDETGALQLDGAATTAPELTAQLERARGWVTVQAAASVDVAHMARALDALCDLEGLSVLYAGTATAEAHASRFAEVADVLAGTPGEILILSDGRADWALHAALMQAMASRRLSRLALGALDANGQLVRLRQDLPVDAPG